MDEQKKLPFDGLSPAQLYAIARLALWAGDLKYADDLLKAALGDKARLRRSGQIDFYEDPIAFAARRLRNQLSRRRSECRRLLKASGLASEELKESPTILTSKAANLRGAVWPRDDDRLTMFAFLASADEEKHRMFFRRAIRLGRNKDSTEHVAPYFATDEDDDVASDSTEQSRPVGFAPTWTEKTDDLLLRVVVGEYATVEVNGTWTGDLEPTESVLIPELVAVLDSLDPDVPL